MTQPKKGGRPYASPQLQRVIVPLRLPRWIRDWMDSTGLTRAEIVEDAVVKRHKLKPPKDE